MSKEFDKVNKKIISQFAKDRNMAMATSINDIPTVRIVDTYYMDKSLFIVTYENTKKVQQILKNKNVSLCTGKYEFQGEAYHIGHPLDDENSEIRNILTEVFANWYFEHNDESDPKMCYLQVKLTEAELYFGKKGYHVDFMTEEVRVLD